LLWINPAPGGVIVQVKVVPRSRRNQVVGVLGGALKLKVAAAPEDGQANGAVRDLLARALNISAAEIVLVAGQTQPRKRILIRGLTPGDIRSRLGLVGASPGQCAINSQR
jgi:uncharacterized protein